MSLLNAAMAFGTLAFVVPLAIHLFFRSRFRSMDWGAMFLLRDVVQANRRRMQWHHWILLALRCAIPLLLALAMARPLLSSMKAMPGSQPISLILVIDDSRSMSAAQRSSDAIAAVNELLGSLSRRDEVILIPSSQLNAAIAKGSVQDARDQLRNIRFDGVSVSLDKMVSASIAACSDASHPFRRIVICSDFQENVLDGVSSDVMESLAGNVASLNPAPELDFLNIAADEDAGSTGNVVVESLEVDNPAILVDRRTTITAIVRNDSDAALPGLRCTWAIDGKDMHAETISVPPRSSTPIRWSHTFNSVGGAGVTLSVQHDDALIADNRRYLAIDVMEQVRVWLVDGAPSTQPLESEIDFLKVALSPFAFRASGAGKSVARERADPNQLTRPPQDMVSTKVFSVRSFQREFKKLSGEGAAETPDLLVFANVGQVSKAGTDASIENYLADGGSVLVFDGDQVDPEDWRECPWLPAKPFETTTPLTPIRIEPPAGRYAPWALLGDTGESLFDEVEVQRYRVLEPRDQRTMILLRAESGQPLAMQWNYDQTPTNEPATDDREASTPRQGRVVQFALPCDTAWTNLPLRPVFLPLIQQLVLDLAGGSDQLNGQPGTVFSIAQDLTDNEKSSPHSWRVTSPSGGTQTIPASDTATFRWSQTSQAGDYRFTLVADQTPTESTPQARSPGIIRVVEIPASESVLRPVVPELFDRAIARLGGRSYADAGQWIATARKDRFGLEIWRPLLMLLLAVMILEVLWQQRGGTKARKPGTIRGSQSIVSTGATM